MTRTVNIPLENNVVMLHRMPTSVTANTFIITGI